MTHRVKKAIGRNRGKKVTTAIPKWSPTSLLSYFGTASLDHDRVFELSASDFKHFSKAFAFSFELSTPRGKDTQYSGCFTLAHEIDKPCILP
jgi:hypothetical protein